jgi:hypothetical protein
MLVGDEREARRHALDRRIVDLQPTAGEHCQVAERVDEHRPLRRAEVKR